MESLRNCLQWQLLEWYLGVPGRAGRQQNVGHQEAACSDQETSGPCEVCLWHPEEPSPTAPDGDPGATFLTLHLGWRLTVSSVLQEVRPQHPDSLFGAVAGSILVWCSQLLNAWKPLPHVFSCSLMVVYSWRTSLVPVTPKWLAANWLQSLLISFLMHTKIWQISL